MTSPEEAMLQAGDEAPPFSLAAGDGRTVRLEELRGRPVVLYFYPRDDTPGCTREACGFRDAWKEIEATGAVVLGVSPDDPVSHEKFRARYGLPFTLLSDPDHAVAAAYGAWGEKSMYGRKHQGILRTTFLIDGQGTVRRVFEKVRPEGHAEEVLAAVRQLR